MALNKSNNYLETLVGAGADAQSNLYEAEFTFQSASPNKGNSESLTTALKVRCKNFTPPTKSQDSYPVKYITATIDRPKAKVNMVRNFNLSFRVDANYQVYKALLKQMAVTSNIAKAFVTNDINSLVGKSLFKVSINVLKGTVAEEKNTTETLFTYDNCWITSIDPLKFSYGDSTPQEVRVTVSFIESSDPISSSK